MRIITDKPIQLVGCNIFNFIVTMIRNLGRGGRLIELASPQTFPQYPAIQEKSHQIGERRNVSRI
jgi:hypothetical protein